MPALGRGFGNSLIFSRLAAQSFDLFEFLHLSVLKELTKQPIFFLGAWKDYFETYDGEQPRAHKVSLFVGHGALAAKALILTLLMSEATRPSTMLPIAALLLVVGVGNLWIGHSRNVYYAKTLREASTPTTELPHGKHSPDSLYIKRLRSRANYYDIVRIGGVAMLFTSVVLILTQIARQRSAQRPGSTAESAGTTTESYMRD